MKKQITDNKSVNNKNKFRKIRIALMGFLAVLIGTLGGKVLFAGDNQKGGVDFALRRDVLWYEQPLVWVAAACLFLFLLVVALNKNERQDRDFQD